MRTMNTFREIRTKLDMSQREIGDVLEVTQGNISLYEKGQNVPPPIAAKLIAYAHGQGLPITYDHVYGAKKLPRRRMPAQA